MTGTAVGLFARYIHKIFLIYGTKEVFIPSGALTLLQADIEEDESADDSLSSLDVSLDVNFG